MMVLAVIVVFLAAFAYDFANVKYICASAEGRRLHAACWSATVYTVGLIGLLGVIRMSIWLVIPEIFGLALGSYFGVRKDRD